jgi:hypothetical protein
MSSRSVVTVTVVNGQDDRRDAHVHLVLRPSLLSLALFRRRTRGLVMVPIRRPHTVEWAITDNTAVRKFACTIAQWVVFSRTAESTHRNSVPAAKTLEIALTVIGRTGFRIAGSIMGLFEGGKRIRRVRVEDGSVENVI